MNDENREEMSRYVDVSICHFVVDTDYDEYSGHDYPYSKDAAFQVVGTSRFLDTRATPFPFRSYYVPFLSEKKWHMISYNLLKNVNLTADFPIKI